MTKKSYQKNKKPMTAPNIKRKHYTEFNLFT